MSIKQSELIVALDVENFMEARSLIEQLSGSVDIFKVGSQLFTAVGPMAVRFIQAKGKRVFLDLKFYDIPNTVANAVRAAVGLSAPVQDAPGQREKPVEETNLFMYTLHIEGGMDMMKAAVEAGVKRAQELKVQRPLAVGITVLTSEEKKDNMRAIVLERALLAEKAGLDGVVASSQEAALIRKELGKDFIIVTPGIRPKGASDDDQARITTPADAVAQGSNFLVVGRPIVKAKSPLAAAKSILEEMRGAKK